jgi:hypothetical protein
MEDIIMFNQKPSLRIGARLATVAIAAELLLEARHGLADEHLERHD